MKTFKLKISSPDGDVFNGDAVKLCLRGTEGELAIMAGHIPLKLEYTVFRAFHDCSHI